MITYNVTNEDGIWIGEHVYADVKYAVTAAKRSATCAAKRGENDKRYIVCNDESKYGIYGKKIALVTPRGTEFF